MFFQNKLKQRKGFTLVECVVAIAVFALLVSVVLMIVANARNMSVKASDSEEQLNKLVQNVVADDSKIKYDSATSDYLKLKVNYGGDHDLTLSYNTVSGYKNFLKCTTCDYVADSAEFMNGVSKESFNPSSGYKCPKCDASVALSLICDSCNKTGGPSDFQYSEYTGGYSCLDCDGGYVHDVNYDDIVADASNSAFSISGITPNAIRYGKVETFTDFDEILNVSASDLGSYKLQLTYAPSSNYSSDDVYTLTVTKNSSTDPINSGVIYLPGNYVAEIIPKYSNTAAKFDLAYDEGGKAHNAITFSSTSSVATICFTLNNKKSNSSFDADYKSDYPGMGSGECALGKKWFDMTSGIRNITKTH